MRFATSRLIVFCCALVLTGRISAGANDPVDNPILKTLNDTPPSMTGDGPAPSARAVKTLPQRVFPRPGVPQAALTPPLGEPQVTTQTRQALSFYGGYAARVTLSQQPHRSPIQASAPQPMFRQVKPFQTIYQAPTVSPYLNLYRDEANNDSAPNYFAFVRPQLEQIDANRRQQREIQQLRGQLQGVSSTVIRPQYQTSAMPGTGSAARYMDTAQFYGGLRR